MATDEKLQNTLNAAGKDRQLRGIVARIEHPATGLSWTGSYGDCADDTPFFIASTTKLFTSSIILKLVDRGEVSLSDRLVDVLDGVDVDLDRLHVHKGVNYTSRITIEHLMAQTSGIADYFQGKDSNGESLEQSLLTGEDLSWDHELAIALAKEQGGAFRPGQRRKALYSDTNYQLLGLVIEALTGGSYHDALQAEIITPLGLSDTYLYTDPTDTAPLPLRNGDSRLDIPLAMVSFGPDGGIISTAADLMTFVRAFFEGQLFASSMLDGLKTYNRIFFPLQYGVGHSRFALPKVMAPPRGLELIGHSGLSGAFAFYASERGAFVTGTVNNIAKPQRAFQLMVRFLQHV